MKLSNSLSAPAMVRGPGKGVKIRRPMNNLVTGLAAVDRVVVMTLLVSVFGPWHGNALEAVAGVEPST